MQKNGHYSLYNNDSIKIILHAFWECLHITITWSKYNQLCSSALLLFQQLELGPIEIPHSIHGHMDPQQSFCKGDNKGTSLAISSLHAVAFRRSTATPP